MADLYDWSELEDEWEWKTLLLGNGMSINVSSDFDYDSLYQESDFEQGLKERDRAIFELFDTTNFEVVLEKLRDAIALAEILRRKTGPYRRRFESTQTALGNTVRRVHLEWSDVPDLTLSEIKETFEGYSTIFTTSYDLLAYWAMVQGDEFGCLCDCFWANGQNEFDPDDCTVWDGYTPIYYMHGALHLVVGGSGATRKLTRGNSSAEGGRLLDQFGEPLKDDAEARPLLVTEGSARDKLQAIEGNDYLSHAYDALKENGEPLLVFGHSLGDQDQHLIEAIKATPRPVAISMLPREDLDLDERQARIRNRLKMKEVYFYDAATHPLGSPDLEAPSSKLKRQQQRRLRPA